MDQPPAKPPRPPRPRRRANQVALVGFFLCVAAFSWWYGLADSDRYRRLAIAHEEKAIECHRLEQGARAAGREPEAKILARTATNHEWFSRAYRQQAGIAREQTTDFFRSIWRKLIKTASLS